MRVSNGHHIKRNTLRNWAIVVLIKWLWKGPNTRLWIPSSLQVPLQVNVSCQIWSDLSWCHICCLLLEVRPGEPFGAEITFPGQEQEAGALGGWTQVKKMPKWLSAEDCFELGWTSLKTAAYSASWSRKRSRLKKRVNLPNRALRGVCWAPSFCLSGFYSSHGAGYGFWGRRKALE